MIALSGSELEALVHAAAIADRKESDAALVALVDAIYGTPWRASRAQRCDDMRVEARGSLARGLATG